jgi:endo-1,4-beta-xylanase
MKAEFSTRTRSASVALCAALLAACGGGGGSGGGSPAPSPAPAPAPAPSPSPSPTPAPTPLPNPATAPSLSASVAAKFGVVNYPVGAAVQTGQLTGTPRALLLKHFSSITAEYQMKPDIVWPNAAGTSGATAQPAAQANFAPGDQLADFAADNSMGLRCHTLVWHQTAPDWFFAGDKSDPVNYRIDVQQRLRDYIRAVMFHWPDCYAWDVVNEVATDDPNATNPYRTASPWYIAYSVGGAVGSEYVRDAFLFATQARADMGRNESNLKLMLNDYSTESAGKRANVLRIVQDVLDAGTGADLDGVGHQFHLSLNADVTQVTAALAAVDALGAGLENHVTELDVSIYADPGSCFSQGAIPPCMADYGANPPQAALSDQARLYRALFNAFNRPSVTSVTLWGISDASTWLNTFPVNRTNRPLLFDTAGDPKWAFWAVVDPNISIP